MICGQCHKSVWLQVVFENGGELASLWGTCTDYVDLRDGANLEERICDNPITNSPTYIAETGNIDLHFHTNQWYGNKGFSLTITILGKLNHPREHPIQNEYLQLLIAKYMATNQSTNQPNFVVQF